MKCQKCQYENPEAKKFCQECGSTLTIICPNCKAEYCSPSKFCGDCGQRLEEPPPKEKSISTSDSERKYVTVLFSDMSGYTAMTEKVDPEEVKEIMGKVFGEISKRVAKFEGFIEKFVGDAVMALFGVPKSHEDDPIRAIKVAREIHELVSSISLQYEKRIEKPLVMHTGICTGLVVTGEVNLERGTHGVLGETINIAYRLSGLAAPGEIVVNSDTKSRTEGYFAFESIEPVFIKGKTGPIKPYKVISMKTEPSKTHRLSGIRADLIGRKVEVSKLHEALINIKQGTASIFFVVGDAGTGKSRLIEEFKNSIDTLEIQWREGHSYGYAQNIPYFPLVNLLSRAWHIQDGDTIEQVTKKVECAANLLLGSRSEFLPYLASLYSIKYPETEKISPDVLKIKLHEAIKFILASLASKISTIICIEDLHWADPSSTELLRNILVDLKYPVMFIFTYRPPFSLFSSHQLNTIKSYHELRLQDLPPSNAQSMVESLLDTDAVPVELKKFIRDKAEGNPFYLEELINSILESKILIREDNKWETTKPLSDANIPSNIQGIISARLDRLEISNKKILQEASVIGRTFLYEVLKQISEMKGHIDRALLSLEHIDLIRTKTIQPDLEYIFKHAITQEVVYNGLLKKERHNIHERIGRVMEGLFHDRLHEFYEALAYHYRLGNSANKAACYLIKAGEKAFKRFALDEAHYYYQTAYDILTNKSENTAEEKSLFIDILLKWSLVFHTKGYDTECIDLLRSNEASVESFGNKIQLGMFYVRLSNAFQFIGETKEAYLYAQKAAKVGEEIEDETIIGYSYTCLCYALSELGHLDKAVYFGQRVRQMPLYGTDGYLFRLLNSGLSITYYLRGDVKLCREIGKACVDYGYSNNEPRCQSVGHRTVAMSYLAAGDFPTAIENAQEAVLSCSEPFFYYSAKAILGMACIADGHDEQAKDIFDEIIKFDEDVGTKYLGAIARMFLGFITIRKGELRKGINMVEEMIGFYLIRDNQPRLAVARHLLGRVYLLMLQGSGSKSFSFIAKNIYFLVRTLPLAARKAEEYLAEAIRISKMIGAKVILAQALMDFGYLCKIQGRRDEAIRCFSESVELFEKCEASVYLKKARDVLSSI